MRASLLAVAAGHGSMIMPPPRNAIDAETAAWAGAKHPPTGLIEPYTCACTNGTSPCDNGQACFWFSQGCSIGCSQCDTKGSRLPNYDHCPGESIAPTLNDPKYRTGNQLAPAGSEEDIFKFNPWRAPGRAPVADPCGMAGGSPVEVFNAGAYNATRFAKQGDLGSKVLPRRPSGTVWTRGGTAKVRWQQTAAHGGGYQYRLCPASEPLTEECFQKHPLTFASREHTIRFADAAKDRTIPNLIVEEGGGLGWMKNPLPYITDLACDYEVAEGEHCPWKCQRCGAPWYAADKACPTDCAKHYTDLPQHSYGTNASMFPNPLPDHGQQDFSIEDEVLVPKELPPGDYVLGWRWDCEMTSQVWSNCADITLASPDDMWV